MTLVDNATDEILYTPLDRYLKELEINISQEQVNHLFKNAGPLMRKINIDYNQMSALVNYLMTYGYNSSRFNPGYGGVCKAMDDYSRMGYLNQVQKQQSENE